MEIRVSVNDKHGRPRYYLTAFPENGIATAKAVRKVLDQAIQNVRKHPGNYSDPEKEIEAIENGVVFCDGKLVSL